MISHFLYSFIFQIPDNQEEWERISRDFYRKWNYPNCVGALDGKHVVLQKPINSGSTYYNYKKNFSTVLMALVDANYKFIFVDVGCNGRISDGGVFGNSTLYHELERDLLSLPIPKELPGSENVVPYHIVADEAFPLKPYLMKPFSQRGLTREKRMFNYGLSRGRRCVEMHLGYWLTGSEFSEHLLLSIQNLLKKLSWLAVHFTIICEIILSQ